MTPHRDNIAQRQQFLKIFLFLGTCNFSRHYDHTNFSQFIDNKPSLL